MEVPAMGLSAHEQRVLESIEERLVGSDPKLASLLTTFTRLTAGEALPAQENTGKGLRRILSLNRSRRYRRRGRMRRARRNRTHLRWQLAWPLLWLAVSMAMIAVALVASQRGGTGACLTRVSECAGQPRAHATP
jgi:Protein of unknown function (DUF3040)